MGTSKVHIACRNVLDLIIVCGHWALGDGGDCGHGPGYPPTTKVCISFGIVSSDITQNFIILVGY
jgi:hypothetical protein